MKKRLTGHFIPVSTVGETVKAFIPKPLPPDPPLKIGDKLREGLDQALLALGRLDSAASFLPDTDLLLYLYIRKEAVLSSQIEGTQSSLADLLLFEIDEVPGVPLEDVREVSRYVAALNHGLDQLNNGFPISLRLIKEIHKMLLSEGRGAHRQPGEFRSSQNWIGGSRPGNAVYVPPPPGELLPLMGDLELFLNDRPNKTPALVKAGLSHVQFETIHPFLDGNGRLGRLLITLILCTEKILSKPLLYLSLYFKSRRDEYYEQLQRVRTEGDWEGWLGFFSEAVRFTASQSTDTAGRLINLAEADRKKTLGLGRLAGTAGMVHQAFLDSPIQSIRSLTAKTKLVPNTVNKALAGLGGLGLIEELTGKKRNRIYAYRKYLSILNEESEPGRGPVPGGNS